MAIPGLSPDHLVRLDYGHSNPGCQRSTRPHRTGVSDNLNLLRFITETREHDAIENVTLQQRARSTDICALVIERIRIDLVHVSRRVLVVSTPDGPLARGVDVDLKVTATLPPVRSDPVEDLSDCLPLISKFNELRHVPFEE